MNDIIIYDLSIKFKDFKFTLLSKNGKAIYTDFLYFNYDYLKFYLKRHFGGRGTLATDRITKAIIKIIDIREAKKYELMRRFESLTDFLKYMVDNSNIENSSHYFFINLLKVIDGKDDFTTSYSNNLAHYINILSKYFDISNYVNLYKFYKKYKRS